MFFRGRAGIEDDEEGVRPARPDPPADRSEFTIQDLQELTGWPYISIYRALKGYDSRGKNYTGLLEKCPAISFMGRTVTVSDEDGISIRRRTEAFSWSRELYRQWSFGGMCWLDHETHDDHDNDDDDKSMDNNKVKDNKRGNNDAGAESFTALQHVYSTFSATAEKQNGAISASGFPDSLR